MNSLIRRNVKRLLFFWISSLVVAISVYYILKLIQPNNEVFTSIIWMRKYHIYNPISYILIPCFFFGIIATVLGIYFEKKNKILLTLVIVLLTVLISSPFGGMLYFYHDMQAGWFPGNWIEKMINNGIGRGFGLGWLICFFSFPYSLIGITTAYFLTKKGFEISDNSSQK